jgi:pyruvate/2-oxoglutarate dehydrogenase complex dihydrolipoamide dehydrogenase (E3) component
MSQFNLVVIGSGAAGLIVAAEAKKKGISIALVGNDRPGGDCSYYGCVPTKTLIHTAKVLHYIRRAPEFGLPRVDVQPSFDQIMSHMHRMVGEVTSGGSWEPWEKQGFTVYKGTGKFVSPHEVAVNGDQIRGEKLVIAVGTESAVPPIEGLEDAGYLTNVEAVALKTLPQRLLVLGAGPIGMEFAQLFARLGSTVIVLEMGDQILPKEDKEIADLLSSYLEDEGVEVHTGLRVEKVEKDGDAKVAIATQDDQTLRFCVDEILVATGRQAPIEKLALENAGVKAENGWIVVGDSLRTSVPHIWAVGDCTGKFLFTHVADYQGRLVAHNLFVSDDQAEKADYQVVPWVTFTDPELARVGLTEQEAQEQGIKAQVGRLNFSDVERAHLMLEQKGMIKVVADEEKRILGATVLGPHADELIHEFALAIKAGLKTHDILSMIHAYPTLSEGVRWSMWAFEPQGA